MPLVTALLALIASCLLFGPPTTMAIVAVIVGFFFLRGAFRMLRDASH